MPEADHQFAVGDTVTHIADSAAIPPGKVLGFREEDSWVEVDWPMSGRTFHPDANLWKAVG